MVAVNLEETGESIPRSVFMYERAPSLRRWLAVESLVYRRRYVQTAHAFDGAQRPELTCHGVFPELQVACSVGSKEGRV